MKVTLFMTMSVNGIVATNDQREDFLSDTNWKVFVKSVKQFGNLMVGKKTYQAVKKWGPEYDFDNMIGVEKIYISHESGKTAKTYTSASSPEEALRKLQLKKFKKALLAGGPTMSTLFLEKNLIDEIILNVEPTLIGAGIPLFAPKQFEQKLKLKKVTKLPEGILQLHYLVKK